MPAGHCWCPGSQPTRRAAIQPSLLEPATPFLLAHRVLGTVVGETFGYLLTAAWTLLVLVALGRGVPRWFTALGAVSAVLILSGVLTPLHLPVVDNANFIGYIMWSVWLVIFAILILRLSHSRAPESEPVLSSAGRRVAS